MSDAPWITPRDQPDPFAQLPALAERLGVKPIIIRPGRSGYFIGTKDGRYYDFFDLVNAALDRIDKATQS